MICGDALYIWDRKYGFVTYIRVPKNKNTEIYERVYYGFS